MKTSLYTSLQRKIILLTLVFSFAPLLLLGVTIYQRFSQLYREKVAEQIKYRARSQGEAVDLFLKERAAILWAMADTHSFGEMTQEAKLAQVFEVMNTRAGAFVDLGVISAAGQHVSYVGPYDLRGLNYYDQTWFAEVMSKGIYVSDVYMGFRRLPHFIIAVRRHEGGQSWILRATIDPDIFGAIVRQAKVGRTGDAFILNREGIIQTRPRFHGQILEKSALNPNLFGGGTNVVESGTASTGKRIYAGYWLKNGSWLLVISQDPREEMRALFATRNVEIAIIAAGLLTIILTTVFTTRLSVRRLKQTDVRMSELNAQLVQSDKLAALGKMAAGVAHEINNPLAIILQKTGWMDDLLQEEQFQQSENLQEFQHSIRKIEEHVERARKVVHGMLGYARKMEPRLEDVDINDTVRQTLGLLENYARINNIEIRTRLSADLPIIAGDQAQLQQVFLNLLTNAIDAIGKDGLIEVSSRKIGQEAQVRVTDNGPGIPPEQQKRVFDPFFTTKQAGKGTGLGLWVSYSIMEKMGGNLTCRSEVGKGSTFTVKVPIIFPEKK